MRLCTATEWSTACSLGNASSSVWSYATAPTTYVGATCNGADAAKGAPWASGSAAGCYANDANGKVYDLSGNVAEWTSSVVTYSGTNYFKVRGGSFGTPAAGMSCNFDFVIQTPAYLNVDLGFRCCADHAP
jgi:formylglycine-generating enzyme required for sulfatase activity